MNKKDKLENDLREILDASLTSILKTLVKHLESCEEEGEPEPQCCTESECCKEDQEVPTVTIEIDLTGDGKENLDIDTIESVKEAIADSFREANIKGLREASIEEIVESNVFKELNNECHFELRKLPDEMIRNCMEAYVKQLGKTQKETEAIVKEARAKDAAFLETVSPEEKARVLKLVS